MSNEEVCLWYEKDELSELTREELEGAVARLKAKVAQMEPGSRG